MRPCDAQALEQVAHKGGFARAQVALQRDQGAAYGGVACQGPGEGRRGLLAVPGNVFYNRRVSASNSLNSHQFVSQIQAWARELGFSQIGIAGVDLSSAEPGLSAWLANGLSW
jgi:hypothetical protein